MKKTPWEKWEVDFLREVAATMPVEVIAEKLERTEKAVMAKATRIGADIVSRLRGRRWTRAEVSLFGKFSAEEIAIATCRSIYSVRAMRYKLKKLDEERAGIRIYYQRGIYHERTCIQSRHSSGRNDYSPTRKANAIKRGIA